MKFLNCFLIAFIAIFAVVSARNAYWGSRNFNDKLIISQNVTVKGSNANPRPSYNLTFPVRAGANTKNITYILIRDLDKFGTGGVASINKGGIGFKNVTILFKSETMNGLNVTTEIWGR